VSEPTAIVVMGVAGRGKTTVAGQLAARLGLPLGEADDLHPEANVAKMAAGNPLTDEDRAPWLERVRDWVDAQPGDCVLTCSALRRRYRTAPGGPSGALHAARAAGVPTRHVGAAGG